MLLSALSPGAGIAAEDGGRACSCIISLTTATPLSPPGTRILDHPNDRTAGRTHPKAGFRSQAEKLRPHLPNLKRLLACTSAPDHGLERVCRNRRPASSTMPLLRDTDVLRGGQAGRRAQRCLTRRRHRRGSAECLSPSCGRWATTPNRIKHGICLFNNIAIAA